MLDSIFERRIRQEDGYNVFLDIPEKEFYQVYEDLNENTAQELLNSFLEYRQDDGRPSDIAVKHNKNTHIVTINAKLDYLNNGHTEQHDLPHYLKNT